RGTGGERGGAPGAARLGHHRYRPAGAQRAGTGAGAAAGPSRHQGAVDVGLHRTGGGHAGLGARGQRIRLSAEAVFTAAAARAGEFDLVRRPRPGRARRRFDPMSTFAARFALTEVGDRRWRWFAAAAGFVGVVYAVLSVVGGRQEWANIFADGNGRWGWAPIPVALGLGLCGAMVVLESQQWNAWARAAAALALGWTLGAATQEIAAASGPWPGRIAPALVLTAIVAAAGVMPSRQRPLAAALAAVPLFLSFVVAVQTLLGMTPWTPLGPHTRLLNPVPAVCLLLTSAGWMAAQPRRRPVALLREPSSTGWMMRRLAPMVLVFPLLVVWIRSQRNLSHPMGTWIGSLVFVGLSFVVFLTLLWKAASALDRLDTSRADLQAYAREISDLYHHAPCGYHSLDADGTFVKINDTELAWLGYRREEVIGKLRFSDLLTPPSRAFFERHFSQVQAT